MNFNAQDFFNYYRSCYQLDYKEFTINNILSAKYTYKWFAKTKEELLYENFPLVPYTNKKVLALEKEMELYNLEKKLFYGCFFVLGKNENPLTKDNRVCAPLLLFPASIETLDEEKFLKIEHENFEINRSALSLLELNEEIIDKDEFIRRLSERINNHNYIGLKSFIDKYVANLETEELLLFPTVWSIQKIRSYLSSEKIESDNFQIVPAAGTILVEKSESSLRVLNDLKEMAKKAEFNSSLTNLLSSNLREFPFEKSFYKTRLNAEQYTALQNAYHYSNSVIVGPPGTGKSYTITSIISDAVVNNQSVLVVSKTKQAVEVLRTMLEKDFKLKNYLIHTTGHNYKVSLRAKIKRYLSGISARIQKDFDLNKIENLSNKLAKLEQEFEDYIEEELRRSDLEFLNKLNLWEKWQNFYLNRISYNGEELWFIFKEINQVLKQLEKEVSLYSKRKIALNIKNNAHRYRNEISQFFDALDSSSFSEYKRILQQVDFEHVLKVFPIWLANLSELNAVLPLKKDSFDLVIIDEATQCDIASALPALYRAKRVVIAGDPNQLRHYSFVAKAQQFNLQKKYKLPKDKIFDYRNRSVLDVFIAKAKHQNQISFLREHFRSTPSLIEFSNRQFYDGQLEVLKSTPNHTNEKQIDLINVNGERNKKGINEKEALQVLQQLDTIIKNYKEVKLKPSIGIISPFNSQVTHLKKLLREHYELSTLKQFNVLCGTPYNFQGSEREIILMTFGVCPNTHHSAYIHLNKPEVLNVAITRAKSLQIIITSVEKNQLKQDSLFYQYLDFIENFIHFNAEENSTDQFQNEVVAALKKEGIEEIKCGYPVAGSLLDILVTHREKNYFIDLIGYPGKYREAFNLERYKTLGRTGIKSLPLHYSFWKKDRQKAIKELIKFIY
ncbi:DEAD/DEAH box helicase [Mesonia aquimarina]|uniref:DEAD/DEAH box helicase n=1 Tax=Mesonia aquimarina TaxID=1504967 RepID=UPI000EF598B2|nr:AAA domain-containing protein [Mesonia aquimarina]